MNIKQLTKKIIDFRNERDWEQFHTPKNLAISLTLEASEVLEHFQWKTDEEVKEYIKKHKEEIGDEIGDVMAYLMTLSYDCGIDLAKATENKIDKSGKKYPVEKARGSARKYTEYQ